MWTAQSNPIIELSTVNKPIMKLVPVLLQPALLLISSKATLALFLGAMASKGMMMAKSPATWRTKMNHSAIGRVFDRKMLMAIAITTAAITSKVPCHC